MQPVYKKPTKCNKHQLTIRQHIHSATLIKRFTNDDQRVELKNIPNNEITRAKPSGAVFCTYRAWDQNTEHVYFQKIEEPYFQIVSRILDSNLISLKKSDHSVITSYHCLWVTRALIDKEQQKDLTLNLQNPAHPLPEEQRELLEKKGVVTLNKNNEIESRFASVIRIRQNIDTCKEKLRDVLWSVLKTPKGLELICADSYPNFLYMPISPNTALISNASVDGEASLKLIGYLNRISIESSKKFFFARDFSKCPVQKTPSDWPYRTE